MEFLNQWQMSLVIFGERAIPAMAGNSNPVLLVDNQVVHNFLETLFNQMTLLAAGNAPGPDSPQTASPSGGMDVKP